MEDQMNQLEEMISGEQTTDIPAEEKKVWLDSEGNEVSMSQFIREQFVKFNKSRKDIAEEYGINYRTVYGATVNMENDAEPSSRGRGVVNPKIKVTADNKVYTDKEIDGVAHYFLNGEEIDAEAAATLEVVETDRNTWIKDQVAAGVARGDIAKALDLSYGVVYGLTKETEGTRQKYEVELPNGDKMPRSEYIRMRVAEGVSKSDVAKELGVEYSVVWQATKKDKTDADRFLDTIEALEKFVDKVVDGDKDKFAAILDALKTVAIIEETPAPEAGEAAPAENAQ